MIEKEVNEVVTVTKSSLRAAGLSEDYIGALGSTWDAFHSYCIQLTGDLTRECANRFLFETYGIMPNSNYSSLRAVDKRRRRAMTVLLNCAEQSEPFVPSGYWECRFNDPFSDAFISFLDLRKKGNYSLATINRDIYSLNKFSLYLSLSNRGSFRDINGDVIIGFIKWLSARVGLPTVKSTASTLRLLLKYLYSENVIDNDLVHSVPKVHVHRDVPSTYTSDEINTMLGSICDNTAVGIRNHAMILLAVRLGMRASDICGLQFSNIGWQKNEIVFTAKKTGKYTVLPLTAEIGNAIIHYLKNVRPDFDDPHVFLRFQKPLRALRPSGMHRMVTKAMRDAGVVIPCGKRHGPHALRASLASSMLQNNTPLPVISEILSHSSSDTTRLYLKIDFEHLRKLSMNVPPLEGVWMGGV